MVKYLLMWGKIFVNHWGSYGHKQGNPLQNFQISNQIIIILFYFLWFYFYINFLSKVRYLFMWGKIYFIHLGSYGLKQGNTMQFFKSVIKLYFSCFLFCGFTFYIKKVYQGRDLCLCQGKDMPSIESDIAWNKAIPWVFLKSVIKLYLSCFIFYVFVLIPKSLSKIRYLFMRGKIYVGHWGIYGLEQGNPLKFTIFSIDM